MSDEVKSPAKEAYERCERLLGNADVAWFLAEAIGRPLLESERTLRDLRTSKDAREIAAHVRDALDTAARFLELRRDVAARSQ